MNTYILQGHVAVRFPRNVHQRLRPEILDTSKMPLVPMPTELIAKMCLVLNFYAN